MALGLEPITTSELNKRATKKIIRLESQLRHTHGGKVLTFNVQLELSRLKGFREEVEPQLA